MSVTPILLIGAQKSGTSYLFRILEQDKRISRARLKEPKIFSKPIHDDDDFFAHFGMMPNHKYALDGSTSYLHVPGTADRVAQRLGTRIPVIAVLRDPVERAISGYLHEVKHGRELRPPEEVFNLPHDLDTATEAEDVAIHQAWRRGEIQPHNQPELRYRDPFFQFRYFTNSFYRSQLTPWLELFPELKLVDFRELKSQPSMTAEKVFAWLGLSPVEHIEIPESRNQTRLNALKALRANRILMHDHSRPGFFKLWSRQRALFRQLKTSKPALPEDLCKPLRDSYEELFHEEITRVGSK